MRTLLTWLGLGWSEPVHSLLDTVSLILAVDACYEYVVTDFGNALLLLNIPR